MNTVGLFCLGKGSEKKWKSHTQNQDPKKGPILRRRVWAPTVGAQVLGEVLCPILALEVGPMFQARGQAHEKGNIKHREEKTSVQTFSFSRTANTMHHTWLFDISCYHVDVKCVPLCLPLLPSIHVPSRASSTCCVQSDPDGSLQQMRNQLWRHRRLPF